MTAKKQSTKLPTSIDQRRLGNGNPEMTIASAVMQSAEFFHNAKLDRVSKISLYTKACELRGEMINRNSFTGMLSILSSKSPYLLRLCRAFYKINPDFVGKWRV